VDNPFDSYYTYLDCTAPTELDWARADALQQKYDALLSEIVEELVLEISQGSYEALKSEKAALVAERDVLRKDRERLDWLEAQQVTRRPGSWFIAGNGIPIRTGMLTAAVSASIATSESLREAIDAAMAEAQTKG